MAIFTKEGKFHEMAFVWPYYQGWWVMPNSYSTAADELVELATSGQGGNDLLVYPIAFLYRHAIELNLKEVIQYAVRLHDDGKGVPHGHDLNELWQRMIGLLDKIARERSAAPLVTHAGAGRRSGIADRAPPLVADPMAKLVKLEEPADLPAETRREEPRERETPPTRVERIVRGLRVTAAGSLRMLGAAFQRSLGEDFYAEASEFADRIEGTGGDDDEPPDFESILDSTRMLIFEETLKGFHARLARGAPTLSPGAWAYELELPAAPATKLFQVFERELDAHPEWQTALARGLGLGDQINSIVEHLRSHEFAALSGALVPDANAPNGAAAQLAQRVEELLQSGATHWQRFLETAKKLAGACDRIRRAEAAAGRRRT